MKTILGFSAAIFLGLCAVALAGAPPVPASAPVAAGCHGQQLQAVQEGCHSLQLKAPAAIQAAACHGRAASRLTLRERSSARSMARDNYRATLAAARSAGRAGDGITAVNYSAPAMTMVPAAAPACSCGSVCNGGCK